MAGEDGDLRAGRQLEEPRGPVQGAGDEPRRVRAEGDLGSAERLPEEAAGLKKAFRILRGTTSSPTRRARRRRW